MGAGDIPEKIELVESSLNECAPRCRPRVTSFRCSALTTPPTLQARRVGVGVIITPTGRRGRGQAASCRGLEESIGTRTLQDA